MWERRYGFPRPERTTGGSRLYSSADVETLKLIRRALEQGYRPGEVVGKTREALVELLRTTAGAMTSSMPAGPGTPTVTSVLAALERDDVPALRAELRQAAVMLGPKRFLVEVAHPAAVRVGALWAEGKLEVRHEHMLSECLLSQLQVLMSAYEDQPAAPRVLLATLPDERHDLGLQMIALYLAVSQITPVLLGADTPAEQILKAVRGHSADAVGLLVTRASDLRATARQVRWLLSELPRRVAVWIGGAGGPELDVRDEALQVVATWSDLDLAMTRLARAAA